MGAGGRATVAGRAVQKADGGGVEKQKEGLKPGEGLEWTRSREREPAGWSRRGGGTGCEGWRGQAKTWAKGGLRGWEFLTVGRQCHCGLSGRRGRGYQGLGHTS